MRRTLLVTSFDGLVSTHPLVFQDSHIPSVVASEVIGRISLEPLMVKILLEEMQAHLIFSLTKLLFDILLGPCRERRKGRAGRWSNLCA